MGASTFRTFTRIVLPLISSALVAGFVFTFMVGMITVSAVIFLVAPGTNLASLYILASATGGFPGLACAVSVMLIGVVAICFGTLKIIAKYTKTEIY
jgi:iron(III) transport system permease protein